MVKAAVMLGTIGALTELILESRELSSFLWELVDVDWGLLPAQVARQSVFECLFGESAVLAVDDDLHGVSPVVQSCFGKLETVLLHDLWVNWVDVAQVFGAELNGLHLCGAWAETRSCLPRTCVGCCVLRRTLYWSCSPLVA